MRALTKWRQCIGARSVAIGTDHAALGRILKQRQVNTRLAHCLDKILDFNAAVVYKPGRQNVVAYAIERRPDFLAAMIRTEGSREGKREGFSLQTGGAI